MRIVSFHEVTSRQPSDPSTTQARIAGSRYPPRRRGPRSLQDLPPWPCGPDDGGPRPRGSHEVRERRPDHAAPPRRKERLMTGAIVVCGTFFLVIGLTALIDWLTEV